MEDEPSSGGSAAALASEHVPQSGDRVLLRRESDRTPLGRIVTQIEYAFDNEDYELTARLLEEQPLAAWFGIDPNRFTSIIATISRETNFENRFVRTMSTLTAPGGSPLRDAESAEPDSNETESTGSSGVADPSALAGQVFTLRLQGRPVEAMLLAEKIDSFPGTVLQPLFDPSQGLALFMAVQLGLTAMLAGDFRTALSRFTEARMHTRLPELEFLARDACVKAALIEALYGDSARARVLLEESRRVLRTESWAEHHIDVAETIATAMLMEDRPDEAIAMLDAVPLHEIGEHWPFYVAAVQRTLLLNGRMSETRHRLEMFEHLPIPRVEGQGYTGSIMNLMGALLALTTGDLQEARERIERADGDLLITRMYSSMLDLASGRARVALRGAVGLREASEGLRLLDLWRSIVIAGSYLALGAPEESQEVLATLLERPGGVTVGEAGYFPRELRRLAESEFAAWPRLADDIRGGFDFFPQQRDVLTEREQELLRELAGGASRKSIAERQYISVNTLKAHLRSIYRKLGVSSRSGAVIEGERRGIV